MQINKILEYVAFAVGGVSLFLASLLVFALAAGVPAHEVAVIGGLFPEPPPAEATAKEAGAAPAQPKIKAKSLEEVIESTLSRLPIQGDTSPFDSNELDTLVGDLKRLKLKYDTDSAALEKREASVAERDAALAEQAQLLQDLMAQLDQREGELALREEEVKRDEKVATENENARWASIAKVFASGDAKKYAARLAKYEPEEAAHILINLDEKKQNALLDLLPETVFSDFLAAFSALQN